MYQTLYRKWRPQTFDDVCGQEHVTSILRYQIESGKTSHAYLFCGSRGTGKTTCAKILARALNCEHPVNGSPCGECPICRGIASGQITDVIEMDAASNNGVDNIRDIRDDVAYAPAECKKRVFIIDEVHMLSASAFNALLKTLEEPPEHIVFILATTEMHKIPATILSRCQRYDFRRIETSVIADRLRLIADRESIAVEDDALYLIAKLASGGMRDAIGMLELCAGDSQDGKTLDTRAVADLIGTSPMETTAEIVQAVLQKQYDVIFAGIDRLYREARDITVFWQSLISFYRDMLVVKTVPDPAAFLDLPKSQMQLPVSCARGFSLEKLLSHIRILDEVYARLQKNSAPQRVTAEMALVRLCDSTLDTSPEAMLSRISDLEDQMALGLPARPAAPPIPEPSGTQPEEDFLPPPAAENEIPPAPPEVPPVQTPSAPPPEPPVQIARKAPPSAPAVQKKVLRAFRPWQEAVRKVEKLNPSVSAFLRDCKAYTCEEDGKFYLRVQDAFTVMMLHARQDEALSQIVKAVNIVSKADPYREQDIILQTPDEKKTDGFETIDDLIETAGDTAEV